MANLSPAAQTAVVTGAIVSSLLLLFVCLCAFSRDRKEDDDDENHGESKGGEWRGWEREKQWPGYRERQRQRHAPVSTYKSPLECLAPMQDPPPGTHGTRREVRKHCGYVVCEARAMDPHTACIEYAS
ncbi:hypothetical protein ANO14919_071440 [Xylariales sp. No.14919]|nr:hypothetical protein ANO14919_071440 [Xylariales sp. No.14919]